MFVVMMICLGLQCMLCVVCRQLVSVVCSGRQFVFMGYVSSVGDGLCSSWLCRCDQMCVGNICIFGMLGMKVFYWCELVFVLCMSVWLCVDSIGVDGVVVLVIGVIVGVVIVVVGVGVVFSWFGVVLVMKVLLFMFVEIQFFMLSCLQMWMIVLCVMFSLVVNCCDDGRCVFGCSLLCRMFFCNMWYRC